MSNAAILSIKPEYANQIIAGTKTIELRKSSMGLVPADVVLVYSSAPEQRLSFWFRIKAVAKLSVSEMWNRHQLTVGIQKEDYTAYFQGLDFAIGLHVGEVHLLDPIPLQEIEQLVQGFVPPQGLIWLRDDLGRFERLFGKLSVPLPDEVFPQRSLSF